MRAKAVVTIAYFSALIFVLCAESGLQAQGTSSASQPAAASLQDSANELSVAVGKTVLVDTARPISRIAIGLGEVATAAAVNPTEVMVNGKAPGETSLIIWDTRGGRQFFNVTVRAGTGVSNDNLDAIRRELRTEFPDQPLKINTENGVIFMRGTVRTLNDSDRAYRIATTGGKVVNLLNVDVPPSDPQILLKVRFASVDLSKEQQLGLNIFSTGFGNTIAAVTTGQFSPPGLTLPASGQSATASISNQLNLFAFLPGLNLGATLQALQTKSILDVLAEPNVMASNGKEASFLAGGEYPFPTVQANSGGGSGAVTIQFKEYGVRINFIATITPRGTIHLQVAPEVSSLDFSNSIQISGFDIPAIDTRKIKTEVELSDGQSFAIGGLLDNRDTEAFSKIPFLGDIPILGKFFQSEQKTKTKTELIVIVTPEIVAPIEAGAELPLPKYPGKFLPPNSGIPMNTPDAKTAANTLPPNPPSIPVEKLVDSLKPETPLVVDSASGTFGGASAATPTAAASGSSTQY